MSDEDKQRRTFEVAMAKADLAAIDRAIDRLSGRLREINAEIARLERERGEIELKLMRQEEAGE